MFWFFLAHIAFANTDSTFLAPLCLPVKFLRNLLLLKLKKNTLLPTPTPHSDQTLSYILTLSNPVEVLRFFPRTDITGEKKLIHVLWKRDYSGTTATTALRDRNDTFRSGISGSSKMKSVFSKIPSVARPTLSHLIVTQWRCAVLVKWSPKCTNMSNRWYFPDSLPASQSFSRVFVRGVSFSWLEKTYFLVIV